MNGVILNPWTGMQTFVCVGAFIVVAVVALILWLGERAPNETPVEFKVKYARADCIVVQANNRKEVADKMGHVTYKGGHLVITRTGEKEFTVRGRIE